MSEQMPERFMTLPEIRRAAKKLLPPGPWAFGAGGAETETTLRRNRQAFDWVDLLPATVGKLSRVPRIVEWGAGRSA